MKDPSISFGRRAAGNYTNLSRSDKHQARRFPQPYCAHKLPTSCRRTSTHQCCACADKRPHAASYNTSISGVQTTSQATRWQDYCPGCRAFWDKGVRISGLEPAQTRTPEMPSEPDFLVTWYRAPCMRSDELIWREPGGISDQDSRNGDGAELTPMISGERDWDVVFQQPSRTPSGSFWDARSFDTDLERGDGVSAPHGPSVVDTPRTSSDAD